MELTDEQRQFIRDLPPGGTFTLDRPLSGPGWDEPRRKFQKIRNDGRSARVYDLDRGREYIFDVSPLLPEPAEPAPKLFQDDWSFS